MFSQRSCFRLDYGDMISLISKSVFSSELPGTLNSTVITLQLKMFTVEIGYTLYHITRGGNSKKWTFDWAIAPPKYGGEVVTLYDITLGWSSRVSQYIFRCRFMLRSLLSSCISKWTKYRTLWLRWNWEYCFWLIHYTNKITTWKILIESVFFIYKR